MICTDSIGFCTIFPERAGMFSALRANLSEMF